MDINNNIIGNYFSVYLSEKMNNNLNTTINYIIDIFIQQYPSIISIRYLKNELIIIINLIINLFYYNKYQSFFHEGFYNMILFKKNNSNLKLYIILHIIENYINLNKNNKLLIIINIYKLINICLNIKYLFKSSNYYNLKYLLSKHKLIYNIENKNINIFENLLKNNMIIIFYITYVFLKWKFNRNIQQELNYSNIKNIDEPLFDKNKINYCPICLKKEIIEPSFISTSPYLYCYKCLYEFIIKFKICPVSKIPQETINIIKIFT